MQKIYFPDPGNHQWPDTTVKLRACSTSGLRVTYQLEDGGRGESCHVYDPAATTLRGQGYELSCRITAVQAGNSNFAPAPQVTHTWKVGKLVVTAAFISSSAVLLYNPSAPTVTLRARATAIHPLPSLGVGAGISGSDPSCTEAKTPQLIGGDGRNDVTFNVTVTLKDPGSGKGTCRLYVGVHVDQTIYGIQDVRDYTVQRSS